MDSQAINMSQVSEGPVKLGDISITPQYQDISASFISLQETASSTLSQVNDNVSRVLTPIVFGVPVTQQGPRAFQMINLEELKKRRLYWSFVRSGQSFICANILSIILLIIIMGFALCDYFEHKDDFDSLKVSLQIFLSIISSCMVLGIFAIFATSKRSQLMYKIYIGALFGHFILVPVPLLYLVVASSGDSLNSELLPSFYQLIITSTVMSVLLVIFILVSLKLLRMLKSNPLI